jgi:hypothetical protein
MGVDLGKARLRRQPRRVTAGKQARERPRALEVLFIMRSLAHLRYFQSPLDLLVERGHNVRLLLQREPQEEEHGKAAQLWLQRMRSRSNFTCEVVDHFRDERSRRGRRLRRGIEYVRFLSVSGTAYVPKRLGHSPRSIERLTKLPLVRTRIGLRALYRVLCAAERLLPAPAGPGEYLDDRRPDVLALCESGSSGSLFSTYVKAAKERGIATAICVASWDNLSSKQRTRVAPHKLLVWNETQVREAGAFHGIPADRVAVCGAPMFDRWFSWEPRPRGGFLELVGLDPAKPVILWVGGALNPSERTEAEYAAAWLAALRSSSDPILREAGVLLRPHPYRVEEWRAADFSDVENAAVWPRKIGMPVGDDEKADYYDSIFHSSAVVGLNTSAMIEAMIVGRPVLTIIEPEFQDSQLGTLHFAYVLESSGGAVRVAHSVEENFAQLGPILAERDAGDAERTRRFVKDFVRPHGLERPATPIFVETLERLAEVAVRPERDPVWLVAARWPLGLLEPYFTPLHERLKAARHSTRSLVRACVRWSWKPIRWFVLVWLRAAVRVRLQRLRSRHEAAPAQEGHTPKTEP